MQYNGIDLDSGLIRDISHSNSKYYLFVVLLFSPLLALLLSIFSFKERVARQVILLVVVLYGLTMSLYGDGVVEASRFIYWSYNTFDDLLNYFKDLYFSGGNVDFVQQVLMYLLSRVTELPSMWFGLVALIFGLFYLKSLEHIYDYHNLAGNQNALVHFCFFFMLLPVFYISGSRWGIAQWIFFYGVYLYFIRKEWKYIILAGTSIFFHFSFLGPFVIFLVFLGLGMRNKIYYALIIASFLLQPLMASALNKIDSSSMQALQERVSLYTNEDYVTYRTEQSQATNWYVQYAGIMIKIYLAFGIYYARRKYSYISNDILLEKLFSFCLLLFALANSFTKVPSGGRFLMSFFMFSTLYLIILMARERRAGLSGITIIGLLPMVLYFILELRRGLDSLNFALAAPLPVSFLTYINLLNTY